MYDKLKQIKMKDFFEDFMDDLFSDDFKKIRDKYKRMMEKSKQKIDDAIKDMETSFDLPEIFSDPRHNYEKATSEGEGSTCTKETWTDSTGHYKFSRTVIMSDGKVTTEKEVKKPTVEELTAKMNEHIKTQEFEKAAKMRDMINELKAEPKS